MQPEDTTVSVAEKIRRLRERPIAALTAYDYPTARLMDESGVDLILVGDSLAMVVAGLPDTTGATMDQMVYHTQIVSRGVKNALIVGDLPIHSYDNPRTAVQNAHRLIEAGAEAVKLEGSISVIDQIRAVIAAGIPLVGHIGVLPQRVKEEGYRKKGRTDAEIDHLLAGANLLDEAGAIAMVLEGVVPEIAHRVTESVSTPTIGIGAGEGCDGQIAVSHDLLGLFPWFCPPFITPRADLAGEIRQATTSWIEDCRKKS